MKRPLRLIDLALGLEVRHEACGGVVSIDNFADVFTCEGCRAAYNGRTVRTMTPTELAARFFVVERLPEGAAVVMVEDEVGGKRFTRAVPLSEAWRFQKAKLGV